jgi:hypothetical protein
MPLKWRCNADGLIRTCFASDSIRSGSRRPGYRGADGSLRLAGRWPAAGTTAELNRKVFRNRDDTEESANPVAIR